MPLAGIALLVGAVAALLWAEVRRSRLGIWIAKPAASTLFIAIAVSSGAVESPFGQMILVGLVLSWLGDVFLIPRHQLSFITGLGSFLLAHVAYSVAFVLQPLATTPLIIGAIAMFAFAAAVVRWLWLHLSPTLKPAVAAYVVAISVMVILACGTITAAGLQLVIGAVLFAVSDVFVARERFVTSAVANRLWGLPLYYLAQLVLALSVRLSELSTAA